MASNHKTRNPYKDMLHLERPISYKHPPMSLYNRAAQFSSFSVLTGYEEKIEEASKVREQQIELDEYVKEAIDLELMEIQKYLTDGSPAKFESSDFPKVSLTYFQKKERKYKTIQAQVKKIDRYQKNIVLIDDQIIPIVDLVEIEME